MIKYLWQLPQNLLGLLVIFIMDAVYITSKDCWVAEHSEYFGVSLGRYIIFGQRADSLYALEHERGHQKQSLYLGPLYLILIGLPSLLGNLLHRIIKFDYYAQPWEKWADKLGGVNR